MWDEGRNVYAEIYMRISHIFLIYLYIYTEKYVCNMSEIYICNMSEKHICNTLGQSKNIYVCER